MKKVLLFAVVVGGLAFTSCSKSECECTFDGVTTVYEEGDPEIVLADGQSFEDACKESEPCKLK
ncbi:MAG: hypothetical protein P8Q14_03225 [Vicingaceae bacterium]|nr:hypothetical protein [Vicingaceae bacterium]